MTIRDTLATVERPILLKLWGKPYMCAPTANVPDDAGVELLKFTDRFVRVGETSPAVPPPSAGHKCEVCGFVAGSKAGLGAHRRKHKERT